MATTTNYGWETPDDTDLVKDGALAQRTTASAIDSSLFSITNGKNVGLVHLNTTTFTGQSSVTISSVFNSSYSNYHIMLNYSSASTNSQSNFQLTVSGTPTTSGYSNLHNLVASTDGSAIINALNNSTWNLYYSSSGSDSYVQNSFDLIAPNLAQPSYYLGTGFAVNSNYSQQVGGSFRGRQDSSTQFDGIKVFPASGTISGTIRIYGYRNL